MVEHALSVVVKGLKLALIVACIVKGKSNYGVLLLFRYCVPLTNRSACVWDSVTVENLLLFVE